MVRLTPAAIEITEALCKLRPEGPLFRQKSGRPLKARNIVDRFDAISVKAGFPVCAYEYRHGFATDSLRQGVSRPALAVQMGHTSTKMIDEVYGHVHEDEGYIRDQMNKRTTVVPSQSAEPVI